MRFLVFIALLFASLTSSAQVEQAVLPVAKVGIVTTGIPGVGFEVATAFCLDADCRFVGTNYHVAKVMGNHFKVKGEPIINRYLATGPNDEGATANRLVLSLWKLKYNASRDLAILELKNPLSRKGYHGLAYSLDDLEPNQEADIWCYPLENPSPKRKLLTFHARFVGINPQGMLAFEYDPLPGKTFIEGGASGGIVVNKEGKVIGVLSAINNRLAKPVAFVVPVQALADFVNKVQPYLGAELFPKTVIVPPVSPDEYPTWRGERGEHSVDIFKLRLKANDLTDNMRHFIAMQSYEWGKNNEQPQAAAKYEVRMIEGQQSFRSPDSKKERDEPQLPNLGAFLIPGAEWSDLPKLVGTNYELDIRTAPDITKNGVIIHVYQYWGSSEDGVCTFKFISPLPFLSHTDQVNCSGEVWTDMDMNILRMSENYQLEGKWQNMHAVVTYDWVKIADEQPKLLPVTIAAQAENGKNIYWCRGLFTDYQVFTVKSKVTFLP